MPVAADLPDPPAVVIPKGYVGRQWHLAIGTTDGTRLYGYNLVRDNSTPWPFDEDTDTRSRDQLIAASPALSDRDLVTYPRITQGDFSGGGNQYDFIQPSRYFDGNLDIRVPGHARLASGQQQVLAGGLAGGASPFPRITGLVGGAANKVFFSWAESDGGYYVTTFTGLVLRRIASPGGQVTTVVHLQADSSGLYISNGSTRIARIETGGSDVILATPVHAHSGMWVVDRGSAGYFLYISPTTVPSPGALLVYDLSQTPPLAATPLPFGAGPHTIVDVCRYGSGIAILVTSSTGVQIWQSDHTTTSLLADFPGFSALGMVNCLGTLYVPLNPVSTPTGVGGGPGYLVSVVGGTIQFLMEVGDPTVQATGLILGAPVSSGRRIFFTMIPGTIGGQPPPLYGKRYIAVYDVVTGALSHRPQFDQGGTDVPGTLVRGIAAIGDGMVYPMTLGGNGYLVFETSAGIVAQAGQPSFGGQGYVVTPRYDFNTPSISKLMRRVIARHAPLQAGESIQLQAWVNQPPDRVYQVSPIAGPVTNATLGSTETNLLLPINTLAKSAFARVDLLGPNSTTPILYDVSTEIGVPFVWTLTLDCSHDLAQLDQRPDDFKLKGQDRYALLRNAQLNGQSLLLVHPTGITWTVAVERLHVKAFSPVKENSPTSKQDFESVVEVTLRAVPDGTT